MANVEKSSIRRIITPPKNGALEDGLSWQKKQESEYRPIGFSHMAFLIAQEKRLDHLPILFEADVWIKHSREWI